MMVQDVVSMNLTGGSPAIRVAIGCACLAVIGLGACESDGRQEVARSSVIRIGTDATFPPFEWHDSASGTIVGFDVDLARTLFGRMGYTVEFSVIHLDELISGLNRNAFDCILSAYTVTPGRQEQVVFSRPYYETGLAIVTKVGDSTIQGIADLVGKRVGVQLGSTGERLAQRIFRAEVFSFDSIGQAFEALEVGEIHAVLNDEPTSALYIQDGARARMVGGIVERERYAAAFRKSDLWLQERFDSVLAEYMIGPEFEQLLGRYGLRR